MKHGNSQNENLSYANARALHKKKIEFNLPNLENNRLPKRHKTTIQEDQNKKPSILPKIKIDSMPHIEEETEEMFQLEINKAKRSERILG